MVEFMGLRIIYGRAGSGKSSFCLQEIKNKLVSNSSAVSEGHPLVLIVPEQFSLQAERNLAGISVSSGDSSAEVLSFRRLAFRVFSEVGGIARRHLNAAGKSMLLFLIMDRLGSELKVFSRTALRKGFTEILSDAITEFKRYDITPEQLIMTTEKLPEGLALKDKLGDLALVYSEFERLLHLNYMDADDDLVELYNRLDQSVQFDGAHIWIDEFSGFTPQEYKVIGKLLKKAADVTICLCTDCLSNEPGDGAPMVFEPVRKTSVKLLRLAAEEGIHVESPVMLGASEDGINVKRHAMSGAANVVSGISPRFSGSEELGHLERNFYKYPYQKYKKQSGDVCISTCANLYTEVEDTARDVIRLCRDKGFRYRDIAVTMRNPDSYSSIVKSVFTRFGIPFFLDGKRDIDGHPLIIFLMSVLEIFTNNWSYESVFRYAKTGLTGIDTEELDLLENYVLANGIRGNAWTRRDDWYYPVEYTDGKREPSPEEVKALEGINEVRKRLADPLLNFRSKTKGGVRAVVFCTALFDLLCETGTDRKIEELSQIFLDAGQLDKANEYRQVWNMVMEVFSQIVEVLGEESIGTERFSEILAAGFAGHKMGLIPPSLDQVLTGSIERARSHDIKALYILGVNEGVLPGNKGDEGLLSDMDRDSLGQVGLELAGNSAGKALEERFMIYMALATPSKYLWLSYPAADRDGRALRPSRVISEVKRILPFVAEQSAVVGSGAGAEVVSGGIVPARNSDGALVENIGSARAGDGKSVEAVSTGSVSTEGSSGSAVTGDDEISDAGSEISDVGSRQTEMPQPAAPVPAFDEMVAQLRRLYDGEKIHDGWRTIYRWFSHQEGWKEKCGIILDGLSYTNQSQNLSEDRAYRLYGKPIVTNISRMEAYSSCPFAYYVKYGLKAKERRVFGFDPVDAGTFMHHIIDEFSGTLVKEEIRWSELDREWCHDEVSKLVDKQLSSQGGSILGSSKRYLYLSDRLKKTVVKALLLISRHISMSNFEPTGYEVGFGEECRYPAIEIELASGQNIKMTGRIDRIDSMTNEDGTYLRIIDYKSGNKALKLGDVYYGLQLQLVTYMDAVLGMDEAGTEKDDHVCEDGTAIQTDAEQKCTMLPAGILYFRLNDPLIRCGRNISDEEIEKAIMKELRMKGLVLADVKLIKAMDRDLDGDSLIIPARINKDGSLGRSTSATQEQFKTLRKYVRRTLAAIGSGIIDGNVTISPYKKSTLTACTYCSYSSVCQFDTSVPGNSYRVLRDYKEDELWRLMGKIDESKADKDLPSGEPFVKKVADVKQGQSANSKSKKRGGLK